ncbi:hypothetical protein INR49_025900 [Caranx melampygus]|nr:hypothetical protein INR49_025900 [Caranx melampygus]
MENYNSGSVCELKKFIFDGFSFGQFDRSPVVNMNPGAEKVANGGHISSEGAPRVNPLPTPETGNGSNMGLSVASFKALGSDLGCLSRPELQDHLAPLHSPPLSSLVLIIKSFEHDEEKSGEEEIEGEQHERCVHASVQITSDVTHSATMLDQEVGRVGAGIPSRA